MKLIIGLGNPGGKYTNNRHNVGYLVIDRLLDKNFPNNVVFKKTGVLMNASGVFVKNKIDQYQLNLANLWVIHDDLDIALGAYKIQFGKGPKDHRGLLSIYQKLGIKDFWHVRIGVENRSNVKDILGEEYVLEDFTKDEHDIIEKTIDKIIIDLKTNHLK